MKDLIFIIKDYERFSQNDYSKMAGLIFNITPVFSVTWYFRNHEYADLLN